MFDRIFDILDYIFPVYIIRRDEVLVIEDRRPNRLMIFAAYILLAVIAFVIWGLFSGGLKVDSFTYAFVGVIAAATLFICARGTLREVYVFDKSKDTYVFTRQTLLKKDVIEGAASQFRAGMVLRQEINSDRISDYIYYAALIQNGDLLLGTNEVQKLRQDPPMYNRHQTEIRIVGAITSFLNITNNNTIDADPV